MKEVITIGGIALIGWALYEWLLAPAASLSTSATTKTNATSATNDPTPSISAPNVTSAQLVAAAQVGSSGTLNVYQWNFYWMQITGDKTTFTPANPDNKITADAYLKLRAAAGLGSFMRSAILEQHNQRTLSSSGVGGFQKSSILYDRAKIGLTH